MSERPQEGLECKPDDLHHALSIHTKKVTDSCRDKDCIEDLRVYLTSGSQEILNKAATAKVRCAELMYTYIDVEPVPFNRNRYCIDTTFYYRILADAIVDSPRPAPLEGLAVFGKRAVLCGEDSHAHIFRSDTRIGAPDGMTRFYANRPTAVVEVLDPMVLSSKVREICDTHCQENTTVQIPEPIRAMFDGELTMGIDSRRLYVTLGQFSIIRLERDAQMVVPVLDFRLPTKECSDNPGGTEDPCELFSRIPFPAEQFSPTDCDHCREGQKEDICGCR